jgi:hypothetical protein
MSGRQTDFKTAASDTSTLNEVKNMTIDMISFAQKQLNSFNLEMTTRNY